MMSLPYKMLILLHEQVGRERYRDEEVQNSIESEKRCDEPAILDTKKGQVARLDGFGGEEDCSARTKQCEDETNAANYVVWPR